MKPDYTLIGLIAGYAVVAALVSRLATIGWVCNK
jgi:hypothetical protein